MIRAKKATDFTVLKNKKSDKHRFCKELGEVKKNFKISIFIVIHLRAPCDVEDGD
jgi:hypothetical protein